MSEFGPFFTEERLAANGTSGAAPRSGQAFLANGFIFVSGQTPCTLAGKALEGSFEEKVTLCCSNIKSILQQAGSDIFQTVKVTVLLDDMDNFSKMNAIYEQFFTHMPARTCFAVKTLPRGYPVEIECIARSGKGSSI